MNDTIIHNGVEYTREELDRLKRAYPLKFKHPSAWGDMPEFYFERSADSDACWIDERLSRLSDDNRKTAAQDYTQVYIRLGQIPANNWLIEFVAEFGLTKADLMNAREHAADYDGEIDPNTAVAKALKRIRDNKPKARSRWGEIFHQDDEPEELGDLPDLPDFDEPVSRRRRMNDRAKLLK